MPSQMTWARNPNKLPKAKLLPVEKQKIKILADKMVTEKLKATHIMPPPKKPNTNYIVDIYTAWRIGFFYFIATRACPLPTAISSTFDVGFARLKVLEGGQCDLAYQRHTGQWITLERQIKIKAALKIVLEQEHYHP